MAEEWNLAGVLDEISKIDRTMNDRSFAFVLGAGASFTSGIPTGEHLAKGWLEELYIRECKNGSELVGWVNSDALGIEGLTYENAAESYPQIFERRFRADREAGYAALEYAMEGKEPSFGYSLLAKIMQNTRHRVVVTTNFDNLVADAMSIPSLSGYHPHPLYVVCLLGLQARAGAGALRRRSG